MYLNHTICNVLCFYLHHIIETCIIRMCPNRFVVCAKSGGWSCEEMPHHLREADMMNAQRSISLIKKITHLLEKVSFK